MSNILRKELYIVFDFKTPNGFLPHSYTHDNINQVLEFHLKNDFNFDFFKNTPKILTKDLHESHSNNQNIFLIVIDERLKDINISKILSKKLHQLYLSSNNFHLIYHNYEISEMYSLI